MNTEYGIGGFSIKSDGRRFYVYSGETLLDSFKEFETAAGLLGDLHLSKKATGDDRIGTKAFCPSVFGNGDAVVVVAKVDEGYIVQPTGSTSRMTVAEEYLSEIPEMFGEER
jgi:hypothetical protein